MRLTALALALAVTGCFTTDRLPPPAPPARTATPPVELTGAPAPGLGRVVLDVDGEPATVWQVIGGSMSGLAGSHAFAGAAEISRPVCTTPCKVDLSPGPQALRFVSRADDDRRGDVLINVDQATTVYRYKFGRRHRPAGRRVLAWATGTVGVLADVAALTTVTKDDHAVPITYGVIGLGLTTLSWWLFRTSHFVEQPGAGTQWSLP